MNGRDLSHDLSRRRNDAYILQDGARIGDRMKFSAP
jgi:hypothetical protein